MTRKLCCLIIALTLATPAHAQLSGLSLPGFALGRSLGISLSCFRFSIQGICTWLFCTPFGCKIKTSTKMKHYNPDVVVEVVNPAGVDRPETTPSLKQNHNNLIFRDAYAYGHPLAGLLICPSQAFPLMPYFASPADFLSWNWALTELLMPDSIIPGISEIGNFPINTWGALYPRSGWTTQSEVPKASAIYAQRVGDIITRNNQLHVYFPLTGSADGGGWKVWEPGGLKENRSSQGDWQMLYPKRNNSCEVFGANDTLSLAGWAGGKVSGDGDYAYTLWRPYSCCERKGMFLYSANVGIIGALSGSFGAAFINSIQNLSSAAAGTADVSDLLNMLDEAGLIDKIGELGESFEFDVNDIANFIDLPDDLLGASNLNLSDINTKTP